MNSFLFLDILLPFYSLDFAFYKCIHKATVTHIKSKICFFGFLFYYCPVMSMFVLAIYFIVVSKYCCLLRSYVMETHIQYLYCMFSLRIFHLIIHPEFWPLNQIAYIRNIAWEYFSWIMSSRSKRIQ